MKKEAILQLNSISKTFPGVRALEDVDFALYPGEVHILAGANGAGKSTLIKCILGIYQPEAGQILYKGQEISLRNSRQAMDLGIAAVHQELTMIPYLDVASNIFYGREPMLGRFPLIASRQMYREAGEILARLHCQHMDLHQVAAGLSIADQQMIEIAKALVTKPEIIILDEPTTSLTAQEVAFLFEQIRVLKEQGIAILFISHRMSEIREIGDRITILRDGHLVDSCRMPDIRDEEIVHQMIGQETDLLSVDGRSLEETSQHTSQQGYASDQDGPRDGMTGDSDSEPLLEIKKLCDYKGKIKDCSLKIYPGEILGLAGLLGSGRSELARLIYGIDPLRKGDIYFHGQACRPSSPVRMAARGMGFLPEDRKKLGLAIHAPIHWNMLASSLKIHFPHIYMTEEKSRAISDLYVDKLGIATPDSRRIVENLSGGNQQKVVLGKWLSAQAEVILFDEPTKGVDVGAKQEIYGLMQELTAAGKSILVISSEMEELIQVCDRIYGIRDGRITGEVRRADFSYEEIGRLILAEEKEEECSEQENAASLAGQSGRQGRGEKQSGYRIAAMINRISNLPPGLYMSLLLMLIFAWRSDHFLSYSNLMSILTQSAALMILSCGQALIVLMQGTDLSLGTMVSMIGVLWFCLMNHGIPVMIAALLCIVCGACCGLLNGWIVAKARVPVFIVTLGTQNIFKSCALLLCGSQTLYYSTDLFRYAVKGGFLGISYVVWIAIACFMVTILLMNRCRFGMRVRGLGGNPQGLVYSGSSISRNQIKVFLYAGIMAAVSALVLCCRIESGNPNAGNGMEFNSIAAVLLGGISMREGKGRMEGIFCGVLLIQILKSGLTQVGMNSIYQNATIGIVVLTAIILDAILKKRKERGEV